MADELQQLRDELRQAREELHTIHRALGNLAKSTDNNPWIAAHKRLLDAIKVVWADNQEAQKVFQDLIQTISVHNTKILNMFSATSYFLAFDDPDFGELLSQQKAFVLSFAEEDKAEAIATLSDALRDEVRQNYAAYLSLERTGVVSDLKNVIADLSASS